MNTAQKDVTVTIQADGATKIEANNFQGVGCKDATKQLEMALAGSAGNTDTKPKPDFYATNSNTGYNYNR